MDRFRLTPPTFQPCAASSVLWYLLLPWPLSTLPPATAVALSPKNNAEWTVKLPGEHWQSCTVLHKPSGEAWKSALYVVYFYLM